MKVRQRVNGKPVEITWQREDETLLFRTNGENHARQDMTEADVLEVEPGIYSVLVNQRSYDVRMEHAHYGSFARVGPWRVRLESEARFAAKGPRSEGGTARILSAMPGRVVKVLIGEGDPVEAGQGILVLEAMKMQNEIVSPRAGIARGLTVAEGAVVAAGALLCRIDPPPESAA